MTHRTRDFRSLACAARRTALAAGLVALVALPTAAQTDAISPTEIAAAIGNPVSQGEEAPLAGWTSPQGLGSTVKVMLLLTVVSLAPAILLMSTCFIRVVVVLGLLRQALGTQQLPPTQVLTSLALFITVLLMLPVWTQTYEQGIKPYMEEELPLQEAFRRGADPMRRFMAHQIQRTENDEDVYLFLKYLPENRKSEASELPPYVYYDAQPGEKEVPLQALLPAFMLSELKTAFLIGFQIYLPFVVIDLVVASVTVSMGMVMLPPVMISLPLKLLLFVLVDGWGLVAKTLLESFYFLT